MRWRGMVALVLAIVVVAALVWASVEGTLEKRGLRLELEERVLRLEKRADWLVGCEERRLKEAWGVGQEMDWGCCSERR